MRKSLQQTIENRTLSEKAIIPYIMAGDGGFDRTLTAIKLLQESGATALELGIPFSDPVADGPIIEAAGIRALRSGVNITNTLSFLQANKDAIKIPIIIMTYLNPIFNMGVASFVKQAIAANVKGLIIPDMPIEEKELISAHLENTDLALIQLVSLTSSESRIAQIADQSEGFLYAVTLNGTTGSTATGDEQLQNHLRKVKSLSKIPVLAGFGIHDRHTAEIISQNIDGVIVGSAFVQALHEGNEEFIHTFFKNKVKLF
ncbi:tryptophan synthase alpha chain [Kurthia zopfii]|uniref:Tryptophan synthase alpha chain n=1 Tax=Kurthia zopfii TaxID=1650 RepID=A0A8B4QAS2_9BACL|nr:tryptophan synthase subunit alpha [Kurthia zopfii]PWI22942.1 tryptophan synthase subunit alpha [Kurthia zopfii]TDR40959.1 tryptophan synthase alpha chain [Kurthia zopfii]GEK30395.1 tryptophan synthase alpha chain [Kurthia zopfii]STX09791.1 Tryptophan synthase alpha chain [Kurthia zopfii]